MCATIAETYPGFDVMAFNALVAPAGVPAPMLEKLSADIRAVVTSASSREDKPSRHQSAMATRRKSSAPGCASEIARWEEIAKAANIKAD